MLNSFFFNQFTLALVDEIFKLEKNLNLKILPWMNFEHGSKFVINPIIFLEYPDQTEFLVTVLLMPLSCIFIIIFFINSKDIESIKEYSLIGSFIVLFYVLILWLGFDNSFIGFQYISSFFWSETLNINFTVGIDFISLSFIVLTAILLPVCILASWENIYYKVKEYYLILLIIEFLLLIFFSVLDLIFFYIFFESILIPMFILILVWGSRERKIHAALQFFLFTLLGSIFMILGIIFVQSELGTTDIQIFINTEFSKDIQKLLWLTFFIPCAFKIPMFPFHIWLPEAHVEAPTAGSVLLAGVLLKLGTYGILRIILPTFDYANVFYTPLVFSFAIIGIIYSSFTTIRQIDLKKIIAYSSVAHMNFVLIGLFSINSIAISGSIFLMLSHGLVSSGLFLCVGILYDRYHTRLLKYYGGLIQFMPIFGFYFLFFSLANIGLPGTSSFIGELLIMVGAFNFNIFATILSGIGMITGACYAMWLYNRVVYWKVNYNFINKYSDLNLREFFILFYLTLMIIFIGIFPNFILDGFLLYSIDKSFLI